MHDTLGHLRLLSAVMDTQCRQVPPAGYSSACTRGGAHPQWQLGLLCWGPLHMTRCLRCWGGQLVCPGCCPQTQPARGMSGWVPCTRRPCRLHRHAEVTIWSGAEQRLSDCCFGQGRHSRLTCRPSASAASGAAGTTNGSGSACSRPAARSTASMRCDTCRPGHTVNRAMCSCLLAAKVHCHTWAALNECSFQQSRS